jgi:hypothetical protein
MSNEGWGGMCFDKVAGLVAYFAYFTKRSTAWLNIAFDMCQSGRNHWLALKHNKNNGIDDYLVRPTVA